MKTTPELFEMMVAYIEQHDDFMKPLAYCRNPQEQNRYNQQWTELTDLLNEKFTSLGGEPRSNQKWRRILSDFQTNTKRKLAKLKNNEMRAALTNVERRLLILLENVGGRKRKASESDDDDKTEFIKLEMNPDSSRRTSSLSRYFHEESETTRPRQPSVSSCASTSSSSQSTAGNRKKRSKIDIKDFTDRYLEYEREREKMAHDREMARIQQNDKFITLFDRIVNVLENVSPSLQRYLDRS